MNDKKRQPKARALSEMTDDELKHVFNNADLPSEKHAVLAEFKKREKILQAMLDEVDA